MVQLLTLVFIAAVAALVYALIAGWNSRLFVAALAAFTLLLVLPGLLQRLFGG